MPLSKDKNRRIYITALVISFLLIVGSIYLHLRQKTHLGRMSFNLDRDRVQPTSGIKLTTLSVKDNVKILNTTVEEFSSEEDIYEDKSETTASTEDDGVTIHLSTIRKNEDNYENRNSNEDMADKSETIDNIMDAIDGYGYHASDYEIRSPEEETNACLRCLCMTVNKCHPTFCRSGNPCGLYRISKNYWIDAGKPTIAGGSTDNEDQDYLTCVNEDTCSSTAIRQYYNRYKRDCNKDGLFNCRDQIALHILGPSGCLTEDLGYTHANRMRSCLIESNLSYFSYSSEEEYKYYVKKKL